MAASPAATEPASSGELMPCVMGVHKNGMFQFHVLRRDVCICWHLLISWRLGLHNAHHARGEGPLTTMQAVHDPASGLLHLLSSHS